MLQKSISGNGVTTFAYEDVVLLHRAGTRITVTLVKAGVSVTVEHTFHTDESASDAYDEYAQAWNAFKAKV